MSIPKDPRKLPVHPLFRPVFDDWRSAAGVLSALPDAPVVADPRQAKRARRSGRRPVLAWLLRRRSSPRTDTA